MSGLPRISGRECASALSMMGFYLRRQEGSDLILRRDNPFAQLVVPDHKELDRGTLRAIIRHARYHVCTLARYHVCTLPRYHVCTLPRPFARYHVCTLPRSKFSTFQRLPRLPTFSTFQRLNASTFQRSNVSTFQRSNVSTFQRSTCQRSNVPTCQRSNVTIPSSSRASPSRPAAAPRPVPSLCSGQALSGAEDPRPGRQPAGRFAGAPARRATPS